MSDGTLRTTPGVSDVLADLIAEQQALDDVVAPLPPERWALPTPSPRWTIADQIAHLTYFDGTAALAIADEDAFDDSMGALVGAMTSDDPTVADDATIGDLRRLPPSELLARWRSNREALASAAATLADDARVAWYGPSMGAKSFLTARLMEAWAHGQDVVDALAEAGTHVERPATDRLRHIAQLGFITRGWTYVNRGLDVPTAPVRVELTSPSGDTWTFGPDDAPDSVVGPALDFCLVTTQRRHVDDTDLVVTGEAARDWMEKAQLFAGPPTDGPSPSGGRPVTEIRPFHIDVPDELLHDLRARLRNTRWPEAEPVDDWSQGTPLAYVQEVCEYWASDYDWRAREAALNRFDQFVATFPQSNGDGLDVHFVHQRSPHPDALPLLITHGWPGSIVEFQKVVGPLTDPTEHGGRAEDAFHVVAPSLPGFGFSGRPTETGWGVPKIAEVFAQLMAALGYDRYVAQGGDWGSAVTTAIGATDADHVAAVHVTLAMAARPRIEGEPTPEEQRAIEGATYYAQWDSGYSKQQSTRPQTVGYGLVDSPAAQAAWILEKFWAWTDCDGHPENVLTRDELLDNVMLYWINGNGASSARLYWESFARGPRFTVSVPSGFTVYPKEIVPPVRAWVEDSFTDIRHWAEQPRGGHFAAFEVPDLFVDDLRTCFAAFR